MILTLKTDSPTAYITLLDADGAELNADTWVADRGLADGLHRHIADLLAAAGMEWGDIRAVFVFRGPGSFTGLRIGISVANALAYGLDVPVLGEVTEDWQTAAFGRYQKGENDRIVLPYYGASPNITRPKK